MIIAIDGTASSGKTSVARELSSCLDFPLVPTGLIYRAITLKALDEKVTPDQDKNLSQMLAKTKIDLFYENKQVSVILDGVEISYVDLRSEQVSNFVAQFSCKPFVREFVRDVQHLQAKKFKDIIVEGRDIGSVVFPNADFKFFVTANLETRAMRCQNEFLKNGENVTFEEVKEMLSQRDKKDQNRQISPLVQTKDAILIDTTNLSIAGAVEKILEYVL